MPESPDGITVVGHGQVALRPDILTARLGAEVTGRSVAEALARCSAAMTEMTSILRGAGVVDADLSTSGASLQTSYGRQREANGWRATQDLNVRFRDLAAAGDLISSAVAAGGDAARIHNVAFAADATDGAATQARELAFADAYTKAEQYAGLARCQLGRVISIREADRRGPSAPMMRMAGFAGGGGDSEVGMPVEAGSLQINAIVEVSWALI